MMKRSLFPASLTLLAGWSLPMVMFAAPETKATDASKAALELKREDFAKFPDVKHPIALDVDEQGRVYVAETYRYERLGIIDNRGKPVRELADLQMTTLEERERIAREWLASGELDADLAARKSFYSDPGDGRDNFLTKYSEKVALLVDTNHDGKADKRTDFAAGFNEILDGPAAGVLAWGGKVWLTCIPNLWLLADVDGDGVAEQRTSLARGFGVRNGWYGHDLHGLALGPEGRIYFTVGDRGFNLRTAEGRVLSGPTTGAVFRCWPDGSEMEVVARGLRNPQELAFDDFGNLFTGDNNCDAGDKARIEFILPGAEYGWEVSYQDQQHRGPWMRENLWQLRPAKDDATYPAWTIPPVAHLAAGPSGLAAYPGIGLPARYAGHLFLCDFRGGGNGSIFAFKPEADGAGFKLGDVHVIENGVGVADVAFGYDGRMYVADWGNAWEQNDAGRIYTLTHEASRQDAVVAEVQSILAKGFARRSVQELCGLLGHRDRRIRMKAQMALSGRPVPEVLESLLPLARKADTLLARVHALWTLGLLTRQNPLLLTEFTPFLADSEAEVRAQAARLLGEGHHAASAPPLIALLKDPVPRVQMMAGLALAKLADLSAVDGLLALAEVNDDRDVCVRHAAVMGLSACSNGAELVEKGASHASRAVRLAAVLALRKQSAPEVARFLADADPQIVTEAARAIYDQNITGAMSALSESLSTTEVPTALRQEGYLRRALEANLRTGREQDAQRVAVVAALPDGPGIPDAFRLVALTALANWDSPPPREGVWSRWDPQPARPAGLARAAIRAQMPELLKFAKGEVRLQAQSLDNKFGAEKSPDALLALIKDPATAEAMRLDYFQTLCARGSAANSQIEAACAGIMINPAAAPRLRVEARAQLIKRQPANTLAMLNEALLTGSTLEKQDAVQRMAKLHGQESDKKLQALGNELVAGTLDPVVQVEVLEMLRHRDEKRSPWRKILEHYDEFMNQGTDPLALHRVSQVGGDADAGHQIFLNHQTAQCLRCHAVGGHGGIVGPDLKGVARRMDASGLLEALVYPSAKVADGYGIVTIEFNDGKNISGVLLKQSSESVTVLDGTTPRTFPASVIKSMSAPLSAMPPMAALLTPRELRDVLAYLQTMK